MCGRFAITLPPEAMRRLFAYDEQPNFPPRYNIAPTQPIPIVRIERRADVAARHFALARWAFLPGFVKDPKTFPLLFNARAEGLAERASFKTALRRRRCLVPADAFYEWRRAGEGRKGASEPFIARRADGETMALAGLWETWTGPNGEEVDTACIVTTAANRFSAAIHPRLPAIVERSDFDVWLDPDETNWPAAAALLRPTHESTLEFRPIGPAVNKVANDGADIQTPIGPPLTVGAREAQASLF